jgi:replicative DNA helicase
MIEDKLAPQDAEIEKTILGAVLAIQGAFDTIAPQITESAFYAPKNALIWQTFHRIKKDGNPIDMVTTVKRLKQDGYLDDAGGVIYISELAANFNYSANVDMLCQYLMEKYIMRYVTDYSQKLIHRCTQDSATVQDVRLSVKGLYDFVLKTGLKGKDYVHIAEAIKRDQDQYDRRSDARNKGVPTGIKTGLKEVNRITGGWQKANLVIIAGRPSMGKTALAEHFAMNSGVPTLFFSIEMSEAQITQRMVVTESGIDGYRYKLATLSPYEIATVDQARDHIRKMPLFINDQSPISIDDMKAKALQFKAKHGEMLVIVDYLQLVKSDPSIKVREQQIADVSRGLKEISKTCDCPVLALAQLSRENEKRGGDKRPILSDLRESGQIEQDADIVMFVHRPEYYGITADENGNSTSGKAELIIAKNRDGAVGTVNVGFIGSTTKFYDFESDNSGLTRNESFTDAF